MPGQHRRRPRRIRLSVEVGKITQAVFLDVFNRMRRAIHAMRVAKVVQMHGAGVVRLLHFRAENRIQAPLLQNQLGDAQVDRFRVVAHDIAVLGRLHVHQIFDELARYLVQRQVLQAVLVAAFDQDVVHHRPDQIRLHPLHIAGDNLILHLLGHADRRLLVHAQNFYQFRGDAGAVPGQDVALGRRLHQQKRLIRQVALVFAGAGIAHLDRCPRPLAHLPITLERRNRR